MFSASGIRCRGEKGYSPLAGLFSVRHSEQPPTSVSGHWCCFDHVQSPIG